MEKPKKTNFKKPISSKEEKFIEEEDNKKSIILIIVAIIAVLGLIFASIFLFNEKDKKDNDDTKVDIKIPEDEEDETEEVEKVTSKTVAKVEAYKVIYLDRDAKQIGETQEVLKLEDRVDEDAPIVLGYRFQEWVEYYDSTEDIYYYIPVYRQNVERIPVTEEPYLDEEDSVSEDTYKAAITKVEEPNGTITNYAEDGTKTTETAEEGTEVESPTYTVEVTGEVEELSNEEIDDQVSIDEQYNHIIALRFNAPEGTTKENIDKMTIKVSATNPEETLETDQYYYNGEDSSLTGRELLDSTDEEYENGEFYFYYYQEVDTQTNATVEVYWGNDPEEDLTATPPVESKPEYTEVYNVDVSGVTTERVPQ